MNFKQFIKHCSQKGIEMVKAELRDDMSVVEQNGKAGFSLFIHKLNDLVVDAEGGDDSAVERLATFDRWMSYHPEIDVIDPLPFTRVLLNRVSMSKVIEKTCLTLDESAYFIPPFCELSTPADIDENNGLRTLKNAGLEFPIICKPMMAKSHDIVVITHEQGLPYAPIPCLAQTFISHYQLLFKLYILGDKLYCVERPSLPDPSELIGMGPVLRFNTASLGKGPPSAFDPDRRKIFITDQNVLANGVNNSSSKPRSNGSSYSNGNHANGSSASQPQQNGSSNGGISIYRPSSKALQVLATALRSELNMELFGADVMVDAATGRLACVDVNAFPGYKGVPDFFGELSSFLARRARNEISIESQMPVYIS